MRVRVSRIVLVGLPGAGKTTVGRLLAERLGWAFVDPDREVELAEGLDIPAIFRARGEAAFRKLEAEQVAAALEGERVVVAPGGGWLAQPGARASVPPETVVVWLQVAPAEAARRLGQDSAQRPLLSQGDMATRLAELDGERTAAYAGADVAVRTDDMTPEGVAERLATRLVSEYGIDGGAD
jgi:shikimate kinase